MRSWFMGVLVLHAERQYVWYFQEWLQCYYQPGMKNLVDHQGRTVWFAGNPGPMAPKGKCLTLESYCYLFLVERVALRFVV